MNASGEVKKINDIIIRLVPLPPRCGGFVMEDPDGDYNVYIREQDSAEIQRKTLKHETAHIELHHLQREEWSPDLEEEADKYGE